MMIASKPTDARRHERVPANYQMMLIIHKEGHEIGHTVWTLDMSQGGARIRLQGALIPGQTVSLLPSEDGRDAYPCRVAWWSNSSGPGRLSEAGLEFQTPWMVSKRHRN